MSRRNVCTDCRKRFCKCGRTRIGATFWGDPSIADLRSLCAAKDYEIAQLSKAFEAYAPAWATKDSAGELAFLADLNALRVRYAVARALADQAFARAAANPTIAERDLAAPDEWTAVLKALRRNWDGYSGGAEVPGDLIDLLRRFGAAGGVVDDANVPQPNPSDDVDLALFKKADAATKLIEKIAKGTGNAIPWLAVGAVAVAVALVARRV